MWACDALPAGRVKARLLGDIFPSFRPPSDPSFWSFFPPVCVRPNMILFRGVFELFRPWAACLALCAVVVLGGTTMALAQAPGADAAPMSEPMPEQAEAAEAVAEAESPALAVLEDVNILWVCLAAFLVFFMQAGFAMVECGFTRAKNACNILMKNTMDFVIGTLAFWLVGFGLMFGASTAGGFIGGSLFAFDPSNPSDLIEGQSVGFSWAFLMFQTVFCATAATIISGAMAERTKFSAYLLYTLLITAFVYPVFGHWAWGSAWAGTSWLAGKGFIDFAGSTVVHSIGGWCALAGAIVVGPRIGKYGKDGKVNAIPGHNIPIAALGVFILWLGWFGFNPGSTVAIGGDMAKVAVMTNLAAVAGGLGAMLTSWTMFKKPDPSFTLNGVLAGLVGITAGCNNMTPLMSIVTGFIAGVLVVLAVQVFDKLKVDDPVGAISVHGVCGAFATIAVGLWGVQPGSAGPEGIGLLNGGGTTQLITQLTGVGVGFAWAFGVSLILFLAIKYTIGLRVSEVEEIEGLDIHEHGMLAYPPSLVVESFGSGMAPGTGAAGMMPAHASSVAAEGV